MNDVPEQKKAYERKGTIDTVLHLLRTINTLPLAIGLFFIGFVGFVLGFPMTFFIWIISGDKPIYNTQPFNFFYVLGLAVKPEEGSGTMFMRGVFQLSRDVRGMSGYRYRGLYGFYIPGKIHPAIGAGYPLPARILGMALFLLSTALFVLPFLPCFKAREPFFRANRRSATPGFSPARNRILHSFQHFPDRFILRQISGGLSLPVL